MMDFSPVAVVTGSRRGIGRCIAETLEHGGWRVVYSAVSGAMDGVAHYVPCDISSDADRHRLLEETLRRFGRVDLLVNNAGVAPAERRDILEMTEKSYDHVLDTNLKGTFFLSQLFARQMIVQGEITRTAGMSPAGVMCGRIVNIASISSYTASTQRGEYCIAKAGISMITQLFAVRLAEYGIGVFEIRPGIIETDMIAPVREKYEKLIASGLTPIQRFGRPADVAAAVLACCSGSLDFSTGQVLNVDGGFHIRRL